MAAQAAIDVERMRPERTFETLREHDLNDVAGNDIVLGATHDGLVLLLGKVRADGPCLTLRERTGGLRRPLQASGQMLHLGARFVVRGAPG